MPKFDNLTQYVSSTTGLKYSFYSGTSAALAGISGKLISKAYTLENPTFQYMFAAVSLLLLIFFNIKLWANMTQAYKYQSTSETQVQITIFNNLALAVASFIIFHETSMFSIKWILGIACLTIGGLLLK